MVPTTVQSIFRATERRDTSTSTYAPEVPHVMDITALLQRDDDRGLPRLGFRDVTVQVVTTFPAQTLLAAASETEYGPWGFEATHLEHPT